jgi:hypothetical protein
MSNSPPYPGSSEPPRPDAGPSYNATSQPGRYPGVQDPQSQYPGSAPYPGAQQDFGGPYPLGPDAGDQPVSGASPYAGPDPLVASSFTDWWGKVVGVLARSWQPLLIIHLALLVPAAVVGGLVAGAALATTPVPSTGSFAVALLGVAVYITAFLLVPGASLFVVVRQAAGERVGAGAGLAAAARRAGPLVGWGFLVYLLIVIGIFLLVLPGLYVMVVFLVSFAGVVMCERAGAGRMFGLVNAELGQTLGRVLSFVLVCVVYGYVAQIVVEALVGAGTVAELLTFLLSLPLTFATMGVSAVTYATLRSQENSAVTTPTLAAELDRP